VAERPSGTGAEAGTPDSQSPAHGSDEEIDEAAAESFPASDAPQWWSGDPADEQ
jgi:hypothetical protein